MRTLRFAVTLAAFGLLAAAPVAAHDIEASNLTIVHPWARATAANAQSGGVFMIIENHADQIERLVGVSSSVAQRVDIHHTINDDGVMRMRPVADIDVPAKGQAELAPGGLHIMLIGLEQQLAEDSLFPLTLHFENAGDVEIEVLVQGAGAAAPITADAPVHDHGNAAAHDHGNAAAHDHSQ